jgi:hypothetical protein
MNATCYRIEGTCYPEALSVNNMNLQKIQSQLIKLSIHLYAEVFKLKKKARS